MHQPVGELARGREHQQALAVEVEATHGDPFRASELRQLIEHRWPSFRIGAAHDLAGRFVVEQHAGARGRETQPHQLAVDPHLIVRTDFLTDLRGLPVDGNTASDDQLFEPAQRTVTALRQHLVQALRLGEDRLSGASGWIRVGPVVRPTHRLQRCHRMRMPGG